MKNSKRLLILAVVLFSLVLVSCGGSSDTPAESADSASVVKVSNDPYIETLSDEARDCVECHAKETHGIVEDWDDSRHATENVSCIDCHEVDDDSPMALKNVNGHGDVKVSVSLLVPPSVCEECHEDEVSEFHASGHQRAALQVESKDAMQALINHHEGRDHPEFGGASEETGCMVCHGVRFDVDSTGRPSPETYPSSGIGNVYPNGEVGNCVVCHTRHKFNIAEARKPEACASCHIGPDHPDLEIYENSKHGQIFATEGEEWKWDSAPGEWEPGDYRAPTCATCHMSGIGDLEVTHNVSERLYWNLWAKVSKVRSDPDPMSMWTGDGEAGRAKMEQVCSECHTSTLTEGFFASGDKAVNLYNVAYWEPIEAMRVELAEAGLLKENPWNDEFMVLHYHIWHHDGRRARQGAMMGGPDWAHWHGFFMLQQKLYRATSIYEQRMESGQIEEDYFAGAMQ